MRLKKTYSSREVGAITGLSRRQLQVWGSGGLVAPAIPPRRTEAGGYTERRYTPIDLFELSVLADLRRRGFSVHQLYLLRHALRTHFGVRLYEATGGGGRVHLLTDGRQIYLRTDRGDVYNVLDAPAQPLLVVGNEGLLKELGTSLKTFRRKKPSGSEKSSRGRRRGAG